MNTHPRSALKLIGKPEWDEFVEFYDEMTIED